MDPMGEVKQWIVLRIVDYQKRMEELHKLIRAGLRQCHQLMESHQARREARIAALERRNGELSHLASSLMHSSFGQLLQRAPSDSLTPLDSNAATVKGVESWLENQLALHSREFHQKLAALRAHLPDADFDDRLRYLQRRFEEMKKERLSLSRLMDLVTSLMEHRDLNETPEASGTAAVASSFPMASSSDICEEKLRPDRCPEDVFPLLASPPISTLPDEPQDVSRVCMETCMGEFNGINFSDSFPESDSPKSLKRTDCASVAEEMIRRIPEIPYPVECLPDPSGDLQVEESSCMPSPAETLPFGLNSARNGPDDPEESGRTVAEQELAALIRHPDSLTPLSPFYRLWDLIERLRARELGLSRTDDRPACLWLVAYSEDPNPRWMHRRLKLVLFKDLRSLLWELGRPAGGG